MHLRPGWLVLTFEIQDGNLKMSVMTAGELQSGNVVIVEKNPLVVLKRQTTKSGRNAAVVKLRLKNLMTDRISESVMKAEEKMETVVLEKEGLLLFLLRRTQSRVRRLGIQPVRNRC